MNNNSVIMSHDRSSTLLLKKAALTHNPSLSVYFPGGLHWRKMAGLISLSYIPCFPEQKQKEVTLEG